MKSESAFVISGWLHGQRVRKNFATRAEADVERQVLEIQALGSDTGVRKAITRLSDDQLVEAEAVFRCLAGRSQSLKVYVDYALANYREPQDQKKLTAAIAEYVAAKEHEHAQDLLSVAQLDRIRRDLKRLDQRFPQTTVAELTAPRLVEFFETGQRSLKTYNNRRGIVSTFLKYADVKSWIHENPVGADSRSPHSAAPLWSGDADR